MADWWSSYIGKRASKHGLDPRAVLSVAAMEGLSGGIGDQGTSFGPFQLHIGGANPYSDPQRARSFAESREGIDYALRKMAESGAKGQKGRAAIESIVRRFERPADPDKEVAGAWARYGQTKVPQPGVPGGDRPGRVGRNAPPSGFHLPKYKFTGGTNATALANSLLSGMSASEALEQATTPWEMHEIERKVPRPKSKSKSTHNRTSAVPGVSSAGDWMDYVGTPERRSGPSAPHTKEILQFVGKVGATAGTKLTPWGNESHSLQTVNGTPSAHGTGRAADIPASGRELIRLGQAALVAAGASRKWAEKQTGGLFNIGSKQIIFATTQGGNHFDHVHVGLRR